MLLKRKKIISLEILKSENWYVDQDTSILTINKISINRVLCSCGHKCMFSTFCCSWSPPYKLKGTFDIKGHRICNCCIDKCKFNYIFTFETVRKCIPIDILEEMGLYIPFKPSKTKYKDKNIYSSVLQQKHTKYYNKGTKMLSPAPQGE